jgi:hypothetical protein
VKNKMQVGTGSTPVWLIAEVELDLYEVRGGEVSFVDDQNFERREVSFSIPRNAWYKLGTPKTLKVGVRR